VALLSDFVSAPRRSRPGPGIATGQGVADTGVPQCGPQVPANAPQEPAILRRCPAAAHYAAPVRSLAIVGLPAAYRRGLESIAREQDWDLVEGSVADVTVAPLRVAGDCAAIDTLLGTGTAVVALVAPLGRDEMAHAIRHGAVPADWDGDPERIIDAAGAAIRGDLLLSLEAARLLTPSSGAHGPESTITRDEAAWLVSLSQGTTVVRLADEAGYSERAMFRRLADLYSRLGARSRTEALLAAERLGLLDDRA